MSSPPIDRDELARLKAERDRADRAYNDALTAVDRALVPPPDLPPPPARVGSDEMAALHADWRLAPRAGDTGWRRLLRRAVWIAASPIAARQQQFNARVVAQLDRAGAARDATAGLITVLHGYLGALATFHSLLIQYLQQVTPYVQTKDYRATGVLNGMLAALDHLAGEVRERAEAAVTREQRFAQHADELRTIVGQVQHGLLALRREIERTAPAETASGAAGDAPPAAPPGRPPAPAVAGAAHRLDAAADAAAYVGFEQLYRGAPAEIRARLTAYVPLFDGAADVLDAGCGRGEFLDLLRERGITARGVDINPAMVAACRARGLEAIAGDLLGYLAPLPDDSLGGLFAAQVVEHLEPDYLVRFLHVAARKLRPGARIVLETINPGCWFAFFDGYLRDITHVRPIHPDTLRYLLGASGFLRTDIRFTSPYPDDGKLKRIPAPAGTDPADGGPHDAAASLREAVNANVDTLNALLFTHLDYAAIGERGART